MDPIQESRAVIDQKLNALQDQTVELRRARNKLSIVNSRLPVELLAYIFRYIVPTKSDGRCVLHVCGSRYWRTCRGWVPVIAHVCSHWRTVALSTPSLWIQCIPTNHDAVRTYLDRSAGLPMVLDISCDSLPLESVKLLLAQLPRARGLRLQLLGAQIIFSGSFQTFDGAKKELTQFLENLPQSLEHLTIRGVWFHDFDDGTLSPGTIPHLTDNVTRIWPPNLHHVYLFETMVDWNCGFLKNLRTLVLDDICDESCLSVKQLLGILEACPEIERLGISSVPWKVDDTLENLVSQQPMSLPRLRFARLDIDVSVVVLKILLLVSFPEDANVWIDMQKPIGESVFLDAAILALRRAQKPLSRLGIACDEQHTGVFGSISGSTGTFCLNAKSWVGTRAVAVGIVNKFLDQDLSCLLTLEVHLTGTEKISTKWWASLFSRTPELRVLCLRSENKLQRALDALQNTASIANTKSKRKAAKSSTTSSNPSPVLLPHLTELDLWFLERDFQLVTVDDSDGVTHRLRKYIEFREGHVRRLEKLTICADVRLDALSITSIEGLAQQVAINHHPLFEPPKFGLHSRFEWDWELD